MKKAYDVLLNFKEIPYEFYEWSKTDCVLNIKEIPIFKIKKQDIIRMIASKIKVEKSFIETIREETQLYTNKLIKIIDYACVFYCDEFALAVEFNEDGESIGKSKMLLDEEEEIIYEDVKTTDIKYIIIGSIAYDDTKTRLEASNINFINRYLEKIKNTDEIKYAYYYCYGSTNDKYEKIYLKIKQDIEHNNNNIILKLKDFIKVINNV